MLSPINYLLIKTISYLSFTFRLTRNKESKDSDLIVY